MPKRNAYHYAGIALMGAGVGYYAVNATSLEIFVDQDLIVALAVVSGELLQLAVFLGLGFLAYRRGTRVENQSG